MSMPGSRLAALPPPSRRLLTRTEAAAYCGMGISSELPVRPIRVRPGKQGLRYDVRELDRWIDGLQRCEDVEDIDAIIDRLDDAENQRPRRQGLRL